MREPGANLIRIPCNQGMNQSAGNNATAEDAGLYYVQNMRMGGISQELRKRRGFSCYTGAYPTQPTLPFETLLGDGVTTKVETPAFVNHTKELNLIGLSSGTVFALQDSDGLLYPQAQVSTCKPVRMQVDYTGAELSLSSGTRAVGRGWPSVAINDDGFMAVAAQLETGSLPLNPYDRLDHVRVYTKDGVLAWASKKSFSWTYNANPRAGRYRAFNPRVAAIPSGFMMFTKSSVQGVMGQQIICRESGIQPSTPFTVVSGIMWDVASYGGSWYVAALAIGSGGNEKLQLVKGTGETIDSVTSSNIATGMDLSLAALESFGDGAALWLGMYDRGTGNVQYSVYDSAFSQVLAPTTIATVPSGAGGPPLFGPYREQSGTATGVICAYKRVPTGPGYAAGTSVALVDESGTVTTPTGATYWGAAPISHFDDSNRCWVWAEHPHAQSPARAALVRWSDVNQGVAPRLEIAGPIIERLGADSPIRNANGCWGKIAGGATLSAYATHQVLAKVATLPRAEVRTFMYETSAADAHLETVRTGKTVVTAGSPNEILADPVAYYSADAYSTVRGTPGSSEVGWLLPPAVSLDSVSGSSGVDSGAHTWRVVVEWVDIYGRRHLSPPSDPLAVTLSGAKNVTLAVTAMTFTQREVQGGHLPIRPLLYRTVTNGKEHHRVPADFAAISANGVWEIIDDVSDDEIQDEEVLYTEGGVKRNDLAPTCRYMAKARGRLWCAGGWEADQLQASKLFIPREPINFTDHDSFKVVMDEPVTAIAGQDDRLLVFAENSIYVIVGDGPNDQGNGTFDTPVTLAKGLGCVNHRSVVETDLGTMFQAASGYWMVPRGLGPVQFVGAGVSDITQPGEDAAYCWASCARTSEDGYLAYFLVSSGVDTAPSSMLVYDLVNSQWFFDSISSGPFRELGCWKDGIALATEDLSTSTAYPLRYQKDKTTETSDDNSSWIESKVTTPWMHPAGENGWLRLNKVSVVLDGLSDNDLYCRVRLMGDDLQDETRSTTLPTGSTDPFLYRELMPEEPRCSAFKVDVYDAYSSVNSINFRLLSLAFEVTDQGGVRPVTDDERF